MTKKSTHKPNIRDVAKAAEVSTTTVSRVLNNSPIPSDKTRQHVLKIIAEMDYQLDPGLSEALSRQRMGKTSPQTKTRTIGYLTHPDVFPGYLAHDGYYSAAIEGVQQIVRQHNYHLMWAVLEPEEVLLPAMVAENRIDGLIIESNIETDLRKQLAERLPTVFVDRTYPDTPADCVIANHERATTQQLEYLWEMDHRNIVMFIPCTNEHNYVGFMARCAFEQFFEDRSSPIVQPVLCQERAINPQTHDQVMAAYARELAATNPRPTAVVALGNKYGLDLMIALKQLGLNTPQDISFASINDQNSLQNHSPALTSYHVPMSEMGQTAVELLLQRIEQPDRPRQKVVLDGYPIERASCRRVVERRKQIFTPQPKDLSHV